MDLDIVGKAAAGVGIMITLDIIAGVTAAVSRNELDSKKLREGLMHKLALVLAVTLAVALEYENAMFNLGIDLPLVSAVATYIIFMEACSVYENIKFINPEFQFTSFEDLFKRLNGKEKEGQDNE